MSLDRLHVDGTSLSAVVKQRLISLRSMIQDLRRDLPLFGPELFSEALEQIVDIFEQSFQQELADLRQKNAHDKDIYELSEIYLAYVREFHSKLLPNIQQVNAAHIPIPILMVSRRLSQYLATTVSLALLPQWNYMYETIGYHNLVQSYISALNINPPSIKGTKKKQPEWLTFIKFPFIESKSALLHTVFAHELGHIKDFVDGISKAALSGIRVNQASLDKLIKEVGQTEVGLLWPQGTAQKQQGAPPQQLTFQHLYADKLAQMVFSNTTQIITNWVKEFVADLMAGRILGPAFVFALVEVSAIMQVLDKHGKTHPSSSLRLKFLLAELERKRFLSDLSNADLRNRLISCKRELDNKDLTPTDPYQRLAFETIDANMKFVRDAIDDAKGLYEFTVDDFNRDVERIGADYLSKGIPPIDSWNPARNTSERWNLVSVINAGWLVYLTNINGFYKVTGSVSESEQFGALNNYSELLLKAIESGEIMELWNAKGAP